MKLDSDLKESISSQKSIKKENYYKLFPANFFKTMNKFIESEQGDLPIRKTKSLNDLSIGHNDLLSISSSENTNKENILKENDILSLEEGVIPIVKENAIPLFPFQPLKEPLEFQESKDNSIDKKIFKINVKISFIFLLFNNILNIDKK